MYNIVSKIIMSGMSAVARERMREIVPAYRKIMRVIASCQNEYQLYTAYRCVNVFEDRFPHARKFSVRLYTEVFNHEHGDDVMNAVQEH